MKLGLVESFIFETM